MKRPYVVASIVIGCGRVVVAVPQGQQPSDSGATGQQPQGPDMNAYYQWAPIHNRTRVSRRGKCADHLTLTARRIPERSITTGSTCCAVRTRGSRQPHDFSGWPGCSRGGRGLRAPNVLDKLIYGARSPCDFSVHQPGTDAGAAGADAPQLG